jgi:hypothetical protein
MEIKMKYIKRGKKTFVIASQEEIAQLNAEGYWVSRKGQIWHISKMFSDHLVNVLFWNILYVMQKHQSQVRTILETDETNTDILVLKMLEANAPRQKFNELPITGWLLDEICQRNLQGRIRARWEHYRKQSRS